MTATVEDSVRDFLTAENATGAQGHGAPTAIRSPPSSGPYSIASLSRPAES